MLDFRILVVLEALDQLGEYWHGLVLATQLVQGQRLAVERRGEHFAPFGTRGRSRNYWAAPSKIASASSPKRLSMSSKTPSDSCARPSRSSAVALLNRANAIEWRNPESWAS